MLQISNIDDKSEWNLNEAHIIIPMIDGEVTGKESEKILTSALSLSPLEGGEQAVLANSLEQSFVIGLDKNLLESSNYKSDLVIIQNSDLKLHSSNSDLKNPVAYAISYVDHDKCEILWQSTLPKDRICESDKAILEVRDVLNYDDSESRLNKTEQQIHLNDVDGVLETEFVKTSDEIVIEKTVADVNNKNTSQFISYFESAQNAEAVSDLQHSDKSCENLDVEEKKLLEFKSNSNSNEEDIYELEENAQKIIFHTSESGVEFGDSQSHNLIEKVKIITNQSKDTEIENAEERMNEGGSNSLPEKSLPLKKKAKMKKTLTPLGSENQKFVLKQDLGATNQQVNANFLTGRKVKRPLTNTNIFEEQKASQSDFDENVVNKASKKTKITKFNTKPRNFKKNIACCLQEDKKEPNKNDKIFEEDESAKTEVSGFNENAFHNINDLIDCLRKCRMINATVWQTLNAGLKEIKIDILKEMNAKRHEKNNENTNYSPQLKAFALVLYFKQPAAFNYLSQIYKNGWPSFNVIKKWKRRMNSCRRPNFIRIENCNRKTD